MRAIGLLACLAAVHALSARCEADVIIDIVQSGGNVVETGSGTINLSALSFFANGSFVGAVEGSVGGESQAIVGPSTSSPITVYSGATGPSSMGPGGFFIANSGSGQTFGIWSNGQDLVVPSGYISGASLSGSSTFTGTTISGLGLTLGTYVFTWGTGGNADSLTVNIGGAVPEPSSFALLGVSGVLGLAGAWFRRKRAAA